MPASTVSVTVGITGRRSCRGCGFVCSPVQPAQDQGKYGIQPRQGKDLQDRVWNLRKFKAAALQRARRVARHTSDPQQDADLLGIGQILPPGYLPAGGISLQIVPVHRAVVLSLPGQQVAGDESRVRRPGVLPACSGRR